MPEKIPIEQLEASLKENFKLSSYESKAYISLLKLGKLTPKQLSANAQVPMPRVYDTVESLMSKGFVLKQEDSYSAIPPKRALHGRTMQFETQFSQEQKKRREAEAELVGALESSDLHTKAEAGEISILKGFNAIANKFSELLENSSEIMLVAKRAMEAKQVFIPLLVEFASGGKKVKIIVPTNAKLTKEEIEAASKASASIRKSDHILFDMMITDLDDVVIGVPDPLSDEINHAIAIWVKNPSFARSARTSTEEIWKAGERV